MSVIIESEKKPCILPEGTLTTIMPNARQNGSSGSMGPKFYSDNNEDSYFDKEVKLKKLNEELEKKSYEIFQKIEEYTQRSKSNFAFDAGDAPEIQVPYDNSSQNDLSRPRTHSSDDFEEPLTQINNLHKDPGLVKDLEEIEAVDNKARKRLQKATESVVRCLQSKLTSHECRLADLHLQFRQKIQENTMLESKVRALEDDREKLLRSVNSLQSNLEKVSKNSETAKSNLHAKNQTCAALKRDVEALRREVKQKGGAIQNLQTRLNRCLDENERLKNQIKSMQTNTREKQHEDKGLIDELQQKVARLQQQKSILNATIGKQNALITTLRHHQKPSGHDVRTDAFR